MVVKKRIPTSLKVDPELWQEVKIMAIRVHKNITEYFEDALRERLVKDYEIVAAERKRKEQERLHKEELDQRYQQIINTDPGVDAYNKEKDRISKTIHQLGEKTPNRLTGIDAEDKDKVRLDTNVTNILQQTQQKFLDIFDKDTIVPVVGRGSVLRLWMPGLVLPKDREELTRYAEKIKEKYKESAPLFLIKKLPNTNKKYKDIAKLEEDMLEVYNNTKPVWPDPDGGRFQVAECRILVDEDEPKYPGRVSSNIHKKDQKTSQQQKKEMNLKT